MTKRLLMLTTVVTRLFCLPACTSRPTDTVRHQASYPSYSKVEELREASDLIVEGTILASRVEELGGTFNGTKYSTAEGILLQDDHAYVMALETYENSPATLFNPIQATHERSDPR